MVYRTHKERQQAIMLAGAVVVAAICAVVIIAADSGHATCQQTHSVDVCAYSLR